MPAQQCNITAGMATIILKISDGLMKSGRSGLLKKNSSVSCLRWRMSDLEKDDYVSSIRNKLLAEAFYLTGDIEKYGTGFVRIRKMLQDYKNLI